MREKLIELFKHRKPEPQSDEPEFYADEVMKIFASPPSVPITEDIEELSEEIHKLYCDQYLKDHGKPYWTNGDYSKLDEKTKEYDRNIARFILEREPLPPSTPITEDDIEKQFPHKKLETSEEDCQRNRNNFCRRQGANWAIQHQGKESEGKIKRYAIALMRIWGRSDRENPSERVLGKIAFFALNPKKKK
ncbi:hypothetical protein LCGC14_0388350 [marine sediment metagenome]|uniref:Uncharacterized protein n=1 Tax=marine sediment metagenome TaxID=412755 RepID=A0A0F9W978_9ZZZZ